MILREIVTKLGFDIDHKKLKEFDGAIAKIKTNIAGLGAAATIAKRAVYGIVAATTGLSLLSLNTAKSAKNTEQLAERLGVTVEELQSVELAAQSTGLGVNELSDSMNTFHKKLGDVGNGNTEASREIRRLGVNFTGANGKIKSSFQLYEELAQKIDAIKSPIARASALQKVFGTENIEIARLFTNGGEAIRKQREEIEKIGYIIDSKGIKSSKEFLKSWAEFQIILSSVKKELSIKFMPVFNDMIKAFKGWFIENRKLISQNISSFINILSKVLGLLFRALDIILTPISKLITLMGGLENTISVLGIAFAFLLTPRIYKAITAFRLLTVTLLANPISWITILVGALALAIGLLIDDLWNWVSGNKSVLGVILKDWLGFEGSFKEIVDGITGYATSQFKKITDWLLTNPLGVKIEGEVLKKGEKGEKTDFTTPGGLTVTKVTGNRLKIPGLDTPKTQPTTPILNPSSSSSGIAPKKFSSNENTVTQYITAPITVTVPTGTSTEQSRAIATQVAQEMQLQFNVNMQRGLDALSSR